MRGTGEVERHELAQRERWGKVPRVAVDEFSALLAAVALVADGDSGVLRALKIAYDGAAAAT